MSAPAAERAGYLHPSYAASLEEFGTPRPLPACGGFVLERPIEGTPHRDAMSCYPLFAAADWRRLPEDVEALGKDLVSLAVVTDPFAACDETLLRSAFPDRVTPFKRHFVADLARPFREFVSRHHRYYAARALEQVRVERCAEPSARLEEWTALYAHLARRHGLDGIKAFSRAAFAAQMRVPGLVMLRAAAGEDTVAAHLWYVQGDVAYSHLAAAGERGYDLMAAYALYWFALETFTGQVRWIHFGAAAGLGDDPRDGLARFKRGWSTETRPAYFCGRVFRPDLYREILERRGLADGAYFPAYRAGEFA